MPFPSKQSNLPKQNKKYNLIDFSNEFNKSNKNQNYILELEKKVSSQSQKIIELQKYKFICEQFIKKLNPYISFPITEEMLSDNYEIIKDPINEAERQNYTDLLKKTIENELIKNGLLNHSISADGIIDLAKIRLECEEYKKQLVLAQSMINSLKNDLVEVTKENEEYKMNKDKNMNIKNNESININNQVFDINKKLISYKNNYEKISKDFEKLLNEKKNIKIENNNLKKEINEYKSKIDELENEIKTKIKNDKDNNNINSKDKIDYIKKYDEVLEEIKTEENSNKKSHKKLTPHKDGDNYIKTLDENNKLIIENERQKEDIKNLLREKNSIEKENEENINKIIELNDKYEKEKEQLQQEINKLKEKYIEKENEKENYNYYIEDTDDDNFLDKKNDEKNNKNKEKDTILCLQEKCNQLNDKYLQLKSNYNDVLDKYNNIKKEKDKIKDIFIKRNKLNNIKNENNTKFEIKKLIEKSIDFKNDNNDSFDYNKINYILWEMDEEIKEKNNIIMENKIKKEQLENEVLEKFKYYDEYITNNKINIKKLLSQLFNLLIQFKEIINILSKNNFNNNIEQNISPEFISDIDKIINQINAINNISNYDIELNDNIFFETLNIFISTLSQELSLLYNTNNIHNNNNFINEEIIKNNEELYTKINNLKNDRNELFKDYSGLKKKNYTLTKENAKLKNDIIDLDNKLNEINLKYNCNQKTVLVNNEGKKLLLNIIYKFIKIISDKELAKIMYDILNMHDQINTIQLNKCLIEEKLNLMENNEKSIYDVENELGEYLLNEKNKLKNLIDDYNNKLNKKNEILEKLNENFNLKQNIYSNYVNDLKQKNEFLINDNEELRNKIILLEREQNNNNNYNNYINDKEQSDKDTYQNSSSKLYNKTVELLDKNKKINNRLDLFGAKGNYKEYVNL